MPFEIDEQVVCPAYGVGRVVGLVMKQYLQEEARLYYEIEIGKSTVWVQVEAAGRVRGLRPITPKADLAHYRDVLRSRPVSFTTDARHRQLEVVSRLRMGTFLDMCEVVRDLSARGWDRPPGDTEFALLRKTRDALCEEWMASEGVSMLTAIAEVDALLGEARQTYFTAGKAVAAKSRTRNEVRKTRL